MQIVTLRRLAAAAMMVAAPVAMAQSVQHTTGTVTFRVFNNGYYGNALGVPATGAFVFNGVNGIFEGQLMVGVSANQVAGSPYAATNAHEWTAGANPTAITPPASFDQAYVAGPFTDGAVANPNPIGLSVLQRTYSSSAEPNNDFGIVELEITSALAHAAMYVGMFADWDVGPAATADLGGYDAGSKLLYVWDNSGGNPNYYGVAVIGHPVSGYTDDAGAGGNPTEPQIYLGLTTASAPAVTPADRRTVIGAGPFGVAAGGTLIVRFAYVGGTSQADIIANANAAQALFPPVAVENTPNAAGYALSATAPNPVNSSASLAVTVPTSQDVRVAVYDVTGREVSVLVDGTLAAGTHEINWDASALPSGVYMVRLAAGSQQLARTVSVAR